MRKTVLPKIIKATFNSSKWLNIESVRIMTRFMYLMYFSASAFHSASFHPEWDYTVRNDGHQAKMH